MRTGNVTRRYFLQTVAAGFALLPVSARQSRIVKKEMLVYIGTYTTGKSAGIYVYRMNPANGALTPHSVTGGIVNPSFLAIDAAHRRLYAVSETGDYGGKKSGAVGAFAIQKNGTLKLLNQQPSLGDGPCFLSLDLKRKFILTANYGGGSVAVLPIMRDGSLGGPTDMIQHTGAGADPQRQAGPHAHCIVPDPTGRYVFAADLGLDKVLSYRFDARRGKLAPNAVPFAQVSAGAGPRHFAFHPNGRFAFVINELNSTIVAFAYDAAQGTLKELQTISTLPAGFSGTNFCADLHVHPAGRFVYGSNRGHDSIAVFTCDAATGRLAFVETVPTQGNWPRNFAIDPTGAFLLAANQRTDNIVTYRIDAQSGRLTPTGQVIEVPAPVCVKIVADLA